MDTLNNNWCIKLDAENRDIIIQYLNENFDVDFQGSLNYYGFYNKLPGNWTVKNDNIQEITFEEFKTQILGKGYKSEILGTSKNNPPIFDNNSSKFLTELDLTSKNKKIQSDGGSSTYYQLEIKNGTGEVFKCELNDIIRDVFYNQFDLGNIIKGTRRIAENRFGMGKKDVSVQYDANKIIWFAEEIKKYTEETKP